MSEVSRPDAWKTGYRSLSDTQPTVDARVASDVVDRASIDIALIWKPPPRFSEYKNLKAVAFGAGLDQLDLGQLPVDVPLARLRDPSLIAGWWSIAGSRFVGLNSIAFSIRRTYRFS